MRNCERNTEVERWFDGHSAQDMAEHVTACPSCRQQLAQLETIRRGVGAVAEREEVRDAQFAAFYAGIEDRLTGVARPHRGLWALASVTAAALLVALSLFLIAGGMDSEPVEATVIESYETELEGASITTYESENGVTTVWVTMTRDDIL